MNASKRAALVTGGAQGIGKAVVERFLKDGMNVLIADRDEVACMETATELNPWGDVVFVRCDVSDETDVIQAVSLAAGQFGRIDTLVCNAGIMLPRVPVIDLTLAQWRRVIDVNLTGCFLCAKHGAPHLEKTGGSIITIASTRAIQSEPDTEPYSASKGGIVALTHALAMSLGPKVRVNCISPGWIDTNELQKKDAQKPSQLSAEDHAQHPSGRVGMPQDIAAMAAFLSSKDAEFITGQNVIVDGGMTRKMIYVE